MKLIRDALPVPRVLIALFALVLTALPALAEDRAQRVYVFGNSLVHYPDNGRAASVPYWLARMADRAGTDLRIDGQWGFLRNFAADPIQPGWTIDGARSGWSRMGFAASGYDTVVITPANFLQGEDVDAPYWDARDGTSPLSATLAVIDRLEPGTPVLIFEGWPDMGAFVEKVPERAGKLARYHRWATGGYADWFDTYLEALRGARPDRDIRLIPVSRELSALLTGPLADVPPTALYTDNAPHGTPALFVLAAAITYRHLFGAPPPRLALPDDMHPAIRAALSEETSAPAPAPLPARDRILPVQATVGAGPAEGMADPSLAMGLSGIADWSTQVPFIDVVKSARPWIGHLPGQWGGMDAAALEEGGYLDANGWPLRIPEGVTRLELLMLTDLPEDAGSVAGTYVVRFRGKGDLRVTGRAQNTRYSYSKGEITFDFTPGDGSVALTLSRTDTADPVRDIRVVRADLLDLHEAGAMFNPDWIDRIKDLRTIRFMDWQFTNGSTQTTWADRPRTGDYTWVRRGVPVEIMVRLANEIGADPWFCMPHLADDAYSEGFATLVRDALDPRLKAHIEYSNELWNPLFAQTHWYLEAARARWGQDAGDGWLQLTGARASEVMQVWTRVFGAAAPARLVRVAAVHTGWPELEVAQFDAPRLMAEDPGRLPPVTAFDAYAVTGYFGHDLGTEERADTVRSWLAASLSAAEADAATRGLTGEALADHLARHRHDMANELAATDLLAGSLGELTTSLFPYHARAARERGLALIMYEGGTHVTGVGAVTEDAELTDFFNAFNYSDRMADLYDFLLTGWDTAGGQQFNAFVDVAQPSKWGSWGALRHLGDDNPRWRSLMTANALAPVGTPRADGTFLHGVTRLGGDGADTLTGTPEEDMMSGGPGNDLLISGGGEDRLSGGEGRDEVILPGHRADWRFAREGALIVAHRSGGGDRAHLIGIETVGFDAEPGRTLVIDGLL